GGGGGGWGGGGGERGSRGRWGTWASRTSRRWGRSSCRITRSDSAWTPPPFRRVSTAPSTRARFSRTMAKPRRPACGARHRSSSGAPDRTTRSRGCSSSARDRSPTSDRRSTGCSTRSSQPLQHDARLAHDALDDLRRGRQIADEPGALSRRQRYPRGILAPGALVEDVLREARLHVDGEHGRAGLLVLLDVGVPEVARPESADDVGERGLLALRFEHRLLAKVRSRALTRHDEARPDLGALGAERENGGEARAIGDATGGDDGDTDGVDDLRHERQRADALGGDALRLDAQRAMTAGLAALRDDRVHAHAL